MSIDMVGSTNDELFESITNLNYTPEGEAGEETKKEQVSNNSKPQLRKVYSHKSFAELCKKPEPIRYFIQDYVQEGALHLAFGESGSGKSFCVIDMSLCIGCEEIDYWNDTTMPIKHGPVIYFAGEGAKGLSKRCAGLLQKYNVPPENVDITVFDEVFHLDDTDLEYDIDSTIENIRAVCGKPALIVVDTVHTYLSGDENKAVDVANFLTACRRLIREFGCAVILIHHVGVALENKGRARGSSSFKAAMDIELKFEKDGSTISIDQTKNKEGVCKTGLKFTLKQVVLPEEWNDENGRPSTTCILELSTNSTHNEPYNPEAKKGKTKLSKSQQHARETYKAACKKSGIFINDKETGHTLAGVDIEDWRKVCYSMSSSDNDSTKRSKFSREREQLLETDKLLMKREIEGREYYCLDLEAEGASEADYRREIRNILSDNKAPSKQAGAGEDR